MANRYLGIVTSDKGQRYYVAIGDTEYSDVLNEIVLDSLQIEYEGQSNQRFQPLLGASATIGLIINSTAIETLLTDIAGAPEGRFSLIIYDGNNYPTLVFLFVGYILTDLISLPDLPYTVNPSAEIKATDAIGILKTIDYNNAGSPYTGYDTILGHIFNCLNKIPAIPAIYGATDDFLKVICNWYPDGRTYDASENPLLITRNNHVAYYTIDSKGNYNYKSCYEVLEEICKAWGARFFYSDGTFWFQQVNELGAGNINSKTIFVYDKNETETVSTGNELRISNSDADEDLTALKRLSGGQFKFFAPLRKVSAKYLHRSTINMLAGQVVTNLGGGGITYETVDYYNGNGSLYFTSTQRYKITNLNGDVPPFIFMWKFTIRVGSYYLVTEQNGTNAEWTTTPGFYYRNLFASSVGVEYSLPFTISSTPLLLESGDLYFDVDFDAIFVSDGTAATGVEVEWRFENLYMELLAIGAFSGQADVTEYFSTNNESSNSDMIDLETILGDGPGLTSPGHLMYLSDDDVTWLLADGWRVGNSGTFKNFTQLLVNEVIRGQLTPVIKYIGQYIAVNDIDYFQAWKVVQWYSRFLIFNGGTFNLAEDIVSGEWYEISLATSYTEGTPIERPSESATGGSPSAGGGSSSSGGGISGPNNPPRFLILEFENVTTSLTVTNELFQWDYSGTMVLWNGRQLKQSDYSFNEPDIDWNFTVKGSANLVHLIFPIQ